MRGRARYLGKRRKHPNMTAKAKAVKGGLVAFLGKHQSAIGNLEQPNRFAAASELGKQLAPPMKEGCDQSPIQWHVSRT